MIALAEAVAALADDQGPPISSFTLTQLLSEARRELEMRRRCYPRWVSGGKMPLRQAVDALAKQRGIVALIEGLLISSPPRGSGTLL